jgi:hypothetical protein
MVDTVGFEATTPPAETAPTVTPPDEAKWWADSDEKAAPVAPTGERPGDYVALAEGATIPEDCNVTPEPATEEEKAPAAEEEKAPAADAEETDEADAEEETKTDAEASGPGACVAEAECSDTVVCGAKSLAAGALALLAAAATM